MLVDDSTKIYVGQTPIVKVYQGSTEIYSGESPEPTYTQVSYLEGTGGQFINTNYTATVNTAVEVTFKYTPRTIDDYTRILGFRETWDNGLFLGTVNNKRNGKFWFAFSNNYVDGGINFTSNTTTTYTIYLDKNEIRVNGISYASYTTSTMPTYAPICLFGAYDGSTTTPMTGKYRFFECKIYESGTLVRDFVPAKDEDSVPCLYDTIGKKLYYSGGDNSFMVGTPV